MKMKEYKEKYNPASEGWHLVEASETVSELRDQGYFPEDEISNEEIGNIYGVYKKKTIKGKPVLFYKVEGKIPSANPQSDKKIEKARNVLQGQKK